jgi:GH15 family glucan-1,4-alpha-glucosidase
MRRMIWAGRNKRYVPIEEYAIIGDYRCAAAVSKNGSMDQLCLPRFDSPALLGAILYAGKR